MKTFRFFFLCLIILSAVACNEQRREERREAREWRKTEHFTELLPDEITAPQLVQVISDAKRAKPIIYCVSPEGVYKDGHIPGAIFIGPASMDEGIKNLKRATSHLPKDADIVVYCGCGHKEKCPNINTSYDELKELGFTNVKKLYLPYGFRADWEDKKYPLEY